MRKATSPIPSSAVTYAEDLEGTLDDHESGKELMREVLSKSRKAEVGTLPGDSLINGIVIGILSDHGENGPPLVCYPGAPNGEPIAAISTEIMTDQNRGSEVALSFVQGNPTKPIILGLIQNTVGQERSPTNRSSEVQTVDVRLDGEKLTLSADKEIVLKCGKSSITLTKAGKVIIKGAYVTNHSTGVNRIKGGSVQIN